MSASQRREHSPADLTRDATLIVRLNADDQEALREVIAIYSQPLYTVAHLITHVPDLAREAVQDAFVDCWNARHTLDPVRGLRGYLATITRRRALNYLRNDRVHTARANSLDDTLPTALPFTTNDAEATLDAEDLQAIVRHAIAELPPRCREIFLMHRQAGMSYPEIEAALGVSNPTIRNQVSRAVQHIDAAIARWRIGG